MATYKEERESHVDRGHENRIEIMWHDMWPRQRQGYKSHDEPCDQGRAHVITTPAALLPLTRQCTLYQMRCDNNRKQLVNTAKRWQRNSAFDTPYPWPIFSILVYLLVGSPTLTICPVLEIHSIMVSQWHHYYIIMNVGLSPICSKSDHSLLLQFF